MLQAILNVPFRITYVAKNEKSGLTDVMMYLKAPDDTTRGPYSMAEMTGAPFAGTYFRSVLLDQQGIYIASIDSTSEPKKVEVSISVYLSSPYAVFS